MILFIVAFLLMALSFLMHQRSNSEVLGSFRTRHCHAGGTATQDALLDLQTSWMKPRPPSTRWSPPQRKLTPPWRRPSGRTRHCWLCTPFSSSILRRSGGLSSQHRRLRGV
ncbi:MAG: hypothetical protein ACLTYN_02830 [Dysosmobacter welbionis]